MIEVYEAYSPLDSLGRCGMATACLGPETLPPEGERRAEIGHIQPSGWQLTSYAQKLVPGESLYNRTHLIARCLCENGDVPQNLITGTQHLNQTTMQPLENRVVEYIRQTKNHVLYRVTPTFEGDELVARGLRVEARSIEDNGAGVSLNMYCYNVQPGLEIDYATGESRPIAKKGKGKGKGAAKDPANGTLSMQGYVLGDSCATASEPADVSLEAPPPYSLNFTTRRFHRRNCKSVKDIAVNNEGLSRLDHDTLVALGYVPCSHCNP